MEKLNLDFTRLFIGLERTLAPPYESVYLGKEHTLFELCTLKVREFYRRFDIHFSPGHNIPDDHLGFELSFCASLCQKHSEALDPRTKKSNLDTDYRGGLEQFLSHHLLLWINPFTSDVVTNADTPYYRGIAYLTQGTVADCAAFLDVKPA
jgi:TorA maturation chaperone TorD